MHLHTGQAAPNTAARDLTASLPATCNLVDDCSGGVRGGAGALQVPAEPYEISAVKARALELFLILHMDHEQNASTSTVRTAGSSQANPYAVIAAGIATLWGPGAPPPPPQHTHTRRPKIDALQ